MEGYQLGEVGSPLKFDDFIKNFEDDSWDVCYMVNWNDTLSEFGTMFTIR